MGHHASDGTLPPNTDSGIAIAQSGDLSRHAVHGRICPVDLLFGYAADASAGVSGSPEGVRRQERTHNGPLPHRSSGRR
ncbi:hypothetical protein GCM10010289_59310 [Streptomyces violascens]|nr:hypothetical protein GCM10010289_59310 [Streptomyces violascens]